jgi:hypothetical protein
MSYLGSESEDFYVQPALALDSLGMNAQNLIVGKSHQIEEERDEHEQ